jgi:hypothetical protein
MPNGDDYWAHKYPLPCETKTPEEEVPEADEASEEELNELSDDLIDDEDEDDISTD